MKKIGNIAFGKDKSCDDLYNVCTDKTMRLGIPSLIVGWENVKKLYPSQSIIDWKINDNTYWAFGRREKRDRYETSLEQFKAIAVKQLLKKLKYVFIDVLSCGVECKKEVNKIIMDTTTRKTVFIFNDMLYIYVDESDNVIGINLRDVEYSGKSRNGLLSMISSNKNIKVINNIPNKMIKEFSNSMYVIPYLYSE